MSFPKAELKRFNDIKSCAPPPGVYDPKLPSIAHGPGISFPKGGRFRQDIGGSGSNCAIPITPSPHDSKKGHLRSASRGVVYSARGRPFTRPSFNRSNSTFSLPTGRGCEVEEDDELELHRLKNPDEVMAKLHAKEDELHAMHDTLERVETERDRLYEQTKRLEQDIAAAGNRVTELEQNLHLLDICIKEKDEQIREGNVRNDNILASLEAVKREHNFTRKEKQELQNENRNLLDNIRVHEENIAWIKEHSESDQKARAELERRIEELQNTRNAELNEQLLALQAAHQALKSELSSKNEELEAVSATIEAWRNQVQVKEHFNNELQSSLEKNIQYIKELESKIEAMVEDGNSCKVSYELKIEQCREELREALTRAAEADFQCSMRTTEIQELSVTVDGLKSDQQWLEKEVEGLKSDIQKREESKRQADELLAQKHLEIEEIQRALNMEKCRSKELKNKIKETEAELDMSVRSFQSSNELVKEEKMLRTRLQEELDAASAKLHIINSEFHERIQEYEMTISVQATELEQVKYNLTMEQASVSQLNAMILEKSEELYDCQQHLKSSSDRICQLETSLEEISARKNFYENQALELQSKLDVTGTEIAEVQIKLREHEEMIRQRDDMIIQKNQEVSLASQTLEEQKLQLEELTTAFEQERQELQQAAQKSRFELDSERNHRENIEKELTEIQKRIEEIAAQRSAEKEQHEKSLRTLHDRIQVLEGEIEQRDKTLSQEQEKNITLSETLKETAHSLENFQLKRQEAIVQIEKLQSDLSKRNQELHEMQLLASHWEQEVATESKKVGQLNAVVAEQGIRIATLEDSVMQKDLELSSVLCSLSNERAQLEALTAKFEVTEEELSNLQKALDTCSGLLEEEQRLRESVKSKLELAAENTKILALERAQEKAEHQKRVSEFESKVTSQAILIAQLKDEIDVSQCHTNELKAHLYEKGLKLEECQNELQKTLSDFERDRAEFECVHLKLTGELDKSQESLKEAHKVGQDWKARYDESVAEREKHIQRLKLAEIKLSDYLNLQLRGSSQTAEIKKSETEILCLKNSLAKLERHALNSKQKLATIEAEMAKHAASSEHWKQLHESASREAHIERVQSQERLLQQESQIRLLEAQNASLQNLIGPFKEQLKEYKDHLDMEQDAAARQAMFAKEIAEKYASLVGHQNPKQRIHHMQKLKNDNLTLKNENTSLQKKLNHSLKRVEDLENKLKINSSRRFDPTLAFKHHDPEDTQNVPV